MISSPFTLRSDTDLLATFRKSDQNSVVLPASAPYPMSVQNYYSWSESSGAYTYLVFKRADWEFPQALTFQKNGHGSSHSPAGMCEWCHTTGTSDQVGLMTVILNPHTIGGSWLCLDLNCQQKIKDRAQLSHKSPDKLMEKLTKRMGEFYERVNRDVQSKSQT